MNRQRSGGRQSLLQNLTIIVQTIYLTSKSIHFIYIIIVNTTSKNYKYKMFHKRLINYAESPKITTDIHIHVHMHIHTNLEQRTKSVTCQSKKQEMMMHA